VLNLLITKQNDSKLPVRNRRKRDNKITLMDTSQILNAMVRHFNKFKELIIKESVSKFHNLPLTEETFKRITRVYSDEFPNQELYYLDSEGVTSFTQLQQEKFVAAFINNSHEGFSFGDKFSLKMEAKTPVENSEYVSK